MPRPRAPNPATAAGFRRLAGVARPQPERVQAILDLLAQHYPGVTAALHWRTPFELLVATILSAQSTDEVVNQVTPELFARYPDPAALARADQGAVEQLIYRTGFFRNKARSIIGAARVVQEDFGGELPRDIDDFVKIPGAARKTANVVLGTAFGIPSGVVVDTHVTRVTARWAFHDLKDAVKIEKALMALVPQDRWIDFGHQTIWHGRRVCKARTPECDGCPLLPHCPEGQRRL